MCATAHRVCIAGKFQLPGVAASPPYRVALSAWRKSLLDFEAAAQGRAIPPPSSVRSRSLWDISLGHSLQVLGLHFYRFTFTRDDEQLEGHVRVSVAYPQEAPRFLLRYSGKVARKTGQLPERTLSESDSLALENEGATALCFAKKSKVMRSEFDVCPRGFRSPYASASPPAGVLRPHA